MAERVRSCLYRLRSKEHLLGRRDGRLPRSEVMQHLADRDNLALVARRQMLPVASAITSG